MPPMKRAKQPPDPKGNGRKYDGKWAKGKSANPATLFKPGGPGGPGRPRGPDFRAVITNRAKELGCPVEDAMWDIYESMLKAAKGGDVQAAKLLIEKLCDNDPIAVHVTTGDDAGPQPPVDLRAWGAKLASLVNGTG